MNQLSFLPSAGPIARRPAEPILRTALIEGELRWDLRRQWAAGPTICWVGLNPSTADYRVDDPTIIREMSFSNAWGFGSMIKLNLYPFRSSTTDRLWAWRKTPAAQPAIERNIRECVAALVECETLVAAWGAGADPRDRGAFIAEVDRRMGPRTWMCIGMTANGSPTHPLARGKHRVPDEAQLMIWRDVA